MKTYILTALALFSFLQISIKSQKKDVEVTIELSKKTYNVFESVDAILIYINKSKKKDSIGTRFLDNYCGCFKCNITDEKGNLYNKTYYFPDEYGISPPKYVLNPNDTILEYTDLLFWGKETKYQDSIYLIHSRFFPPGKYTGYIIWDRDPFNEIKPPLKTNIFKFEVVGNSTEDMKVLELCRAKEFDDVIEKFPNNVFVEDAYREMIRKVYIDVDKKVLPADSLFNLRFDYMKKFPNSFYSINYVGQYLSYIINGKLDLLDEKINEFKEIFNGSFIGKYMNNNYMQNIIKNRIINRKYVKF